VFWTSKIQRYQVVGDAFCVTGREPLCHGLSRTLNGDFYDCVNDRIDKIQNTVDFKLIIWHKRDLLSDMVQPEDSSG
jgi:hypothetical protein